MSFWKNLLGISKKTEIIKEPEHELVSKSATDSIMGANKTASNNEDYQDNVDNKDSS